MGGGGRELWQSKIFRISIKAHSQAGFSEVGFERV